MILNLVKDFLKFIFLMLALFAAFTLLQTTTQHQNNSPTQSKFNIIHNDESGTISFDDSPHQEYDLIKKHNLKKEIFKVSNFYIEDKTQNKQQIADYISNIQLNLGNYYLALLSTSEGFTNKVLKDNKGYILGNGWNLSMQPKEYNKALAYSVFKNMDIAEQLSNLSGKVSHKKTIESQFENIEMTPQQAIMAAEIMKTKFKDDFLTVFSLFIKENKIYKEKIKNGANPLELAREELNKLEPHEADSLIYHTYKVGSTNLLDYKDMFRNLIHYINSEGAQKEKYKSKIIHNIEYHYYHNGVKKKDRRVEKYVKTMFNSPQSFLIKQ